MKKKLSKQASLHPAGGGSGRGEIIWQPTRVSPPILQAARSLRKNMTDAERVLWRCLRGKQLAGFRFRKQHPVGVYILDFYCASQKLAIELDGAQHSGAEAMRCDRLRTEWLNQQQICVLRFWNSAVLGQLDAVLEQIRNRL